METNRKKIKNQKTENRYKNTNSLKKLMNNPEKYKKKLKNKSEWGKKPKYCEICNRTVTNDGWSHHKKTKLHLENLKKQINVENYEKKI